jgi:hypothetical protein
MAQVAQPKEAQVAHFSFIFGNWPIIYNLAFVVLLMPILAFVVLFKTQARPLWYCFKPKPILAHCWLSYLAIGPLFLLWHLWLCPCPFRPKVADVQNLPMISALVQKKKKKKEAKLPIFLPFVGTFIWSFVGPLLT